MDTPTRASIAVLAKQRQTLLDRIESHANAISTLEADIAFHRDVIEASKVAAADIVEAIIALDGHLDPNQEKSSARR